MWRHSQGFGAAQGSTFLGMHMQVALTSIVFDECDHDGLPAHQITVASEDDYAILVVPADRTRCADSSMLHIDVKIPKAHVVVAAGND